MMRSGTYLIQPALPVILGFEAAGTIEKMAEMSKILNRTESRGIARNGRLRRIGRNKYCEVFIPEELTFGEATALLVQGTTALGLLREAEAGQIILVYAAAGRVGSLLVQLAKIAGLKVIGTASSV